MDHLTDEKAMNLIGGGWTVACYTLFLSLQLYDYQLKVILFKNILKNVCNIQICFLNLHIN